MTYWDSSAIIPLVVDEATSTICRGLLREDEAVATWTLTQTEIASSLRRKEREGRVSGEDVDSALARLAALAASWMTVESVAQVKARALRVLASHPLRAADALQLAAALVASEDQPQDWWFISRDIQLRDAARREGFKVWRIEVGAPLPGSPG